MKELIEIQNLLNAPKTRTNAFGGYKYRNCEDIFDAVKPLLKAFECTLTVSDDVAPIGNRIYVKATATITNSEGKAESVTAFAREEETKKGMDAAQITGACSSYARKYALGGLLLVDDAQDPDTQPLSDAKKQTPPPAEPKTPTRPTPPAPIADMEQVEIALQNMTESAQVQAYWKANKESHANPEFVKLVTTYGKKLKDAGK